jgi:hypothetical protein
LNPRPSDYKSETVALSITYTEHNRTPSSATGYYVQ